MFPGFDVYPESYQIVLEIDKKRRWVFFLFEFPISWCVLQKLDS